MRCRFCHQPLVYLHGHAACVDNRCPMYGVNQADCCDGETAEAVATTAEVAAIPEDLLGYLTQFWSGELPESTM